MKHKERCIDVSCERSRKFQKKTKTKQSKSIKVRETLRMVLTSKDVDIEFLESLILAQDERWRRA